MKININKHMVFELIENMSLIHQDNEKDKRSNHLLNHLNGLDGKSAGADQHMLAAYKAGVNPNAHELALLKIKNKTAKSTDLVDRDHDGLNQKDLVSLQLANKALK